MKIGGSTSSRIRSTRAEIERCKAKGWNTEALDFLLELLLRRAENEPAPQVQQVDAPPDWQDPETHRDEEQSW
jgi:hypothetical protein